MLMSDHAEPIRRLWTMAENRDWEAFAAHYRLAPAPDRAAIANAVAHLGRQGDIADPVPGPTDLCTRSPEAVRRALEATGQVEQSSATRTLIAQLTEALDDGDAAGIAAGCWAAQTDALVAGPTVLLGAVRHLYEAFPDWPPGRFRDHMTRTIPVV